jgi:hypothetical protein
LERVVVVAQFVLEVGILRQPTADVWPSSAPTAAVTPEPAAAGTSARGSAQLPAA